MKPGSKDIKAYLKYTFDELDILQSGTGYMAESFGLDSRIEKLTGKRKVGFYRWDLECIKCALSFMKKDEDYFEDIKIIEKLEDKIKIAMDFIEEND